MYSDCIHLCPQNLSYSLSIVTVCIILFIMAVIVIIVMRKARYGQFCCLKPVSCIYWCTYIHTQHPDILLCTLIFIFTAENEIPIHVSLSWHTYSSCPKSPPLYNNYTTYSQGPPPWWDFLIFISTQRWGDRKDKGRRQSEPSNLHYHRDRPSGLHRCLTRRPGEPANKYPGNRTGYREQGADESTSPWG